METGQKHLCIYWPLNFSIPVPWSAVAQARRGTGSVALHSAGILPLTSVGTQGGRCSWTSLAVSRVLHLKWTVLLWAELSSKNAMKHKIEKEQQQKNKQQTAVLDCDHQQSDGLKAWCIPAHCWIQCKHCSETCSTYHTFLKSTFLYNVICQPFLSVKMHKKYSEQRL